jgi:hypothetical protein
MRHAQAPTPAPSPSLDISRRKLLRGIGAGAALLSPFVRHRMADAAPAGNFMYHGGHNGFVRSAFGGMGSGAGFTLLPSLAPLEPYKNEVTTIRGLCHKAASTVVSHEDCCRQLSGTYGTGNKSRCESVTLDHELGQFLSSRPLTLSSTPVRGPDGYTGVSWVAPGRVDPFFTDPRKTFAVVFGGAMPTGMTSGGDGGARAVELMMNRRKSVLDFVREDVGMFKRRLTGTDAANLDLYLEAIRDVERSMAQNAPLLQQATASCDAKELGARAQAAPSGSSSKEAHKAVYDTQLAIAAAALGCGVRRVVTFTPHTNYNPVGSVDYHNVSHGQAPKSHWAEIDKWHAERFATLVGRLKAYGVLSRTILVWGNEIAEDHHQHDCAFVVAGGSALGIKTQQAIRYPVVRGQRSEPNRSWNDLWVSVQKALGKKSDVFGDAKFCTGGLKELFPG